MYGCKLVPKNIGLAWRLATEVDKKQVLMQVHRNLRTDLYQDKNKSEIIPNSIYIDPTYDCNRSCVGCYVSQDKSVMSIGLAEKISDYAQRKKVNYIAWLGGEPLLPKVREVMFSVTNNFPKLSYAFCTNGDFLDDLTAKRIYQLDNLIPAISIDGFEKNHNWRRGKNSYQNAKKAMSLIKDKSRFMGYMTTVMPHNKDEVVSESFVEDMIKGGCIFGGYSLFICGTNAGSTLNSKEYGVFIEKLGKISKEFPIYILSTDFGYMGNKVKQKSKKLIAISVGPNGDVRTERGSVVLGNLNEISLDDLISDRGTQDLFRKKLDGTGGEERDVRLKIVREIDF